MWAKHRGTVPVVALRMILLPESEDMAQLDQSEYSIHCHSDNVQGWICSPMPTKLPGMFYFWKRTYSCPETQGCWESYNHEDCRIENPNSVPLTMFMGAKQGGGKTPQGGHPEGYTTCCVFHPSYLCLTSPSLLFWVALRQSQHWRNSSTRVRKMVKIKVYSQDT